MRRHLTFAAGFAVVALCAVAAQAQSPQAWPDWIGEFEPPKFPRGPGGYFSIFKIGISVALMLAWVATVDWLNRDALKIKQNHQKWNAIVTGPFALAFVLQWVIPWFILSLVLMILAWIGPFVWYVWQRNKPLPDADKVFTPEHIKFLALSKLKRFGVKVPEGGPKKKTTEAPLLLTARGAPSQQDEQVRLIGARQSPGFVPAKAVLFKALEARASGVMLDFTQDAAAVKFMIDGIWLDAETQPRAAADPLLASLKTLCGLKPDERRARQQGIFQAQHETTRVKTPAKLTSQGTKTGERALIQFEDGANRKRRLADMGLRQKLQEDLQALLNETKGLVVIGAPPGGGLTAITTVCLAAVDRFTRSAMAIEDIRSKDLEVENIPITTYDSLEQETPAAKLPAVIRHFPDVLVVPEYVDAETLGLICDEAEERLMVTTVRAKEAAEAFLRPLQTKVSPKKYIKAVTGVVVQRLIRKLCEKCREAYPPPPQILQRLGLPAEKVPAFYRPPTAPRQKGEEPCPECNGLGYKGQTAMVELMIMTDALRQQAFAQPTVEALRAAARKAGMKSLEDEGLLLVVKGITSVQELARVLKEGTPAAAAQPAS